MQKSIYTPLSGAIAQERAMAIIANNLANVNTTSFKQERVTFKLLEPEPNKNYKEPLPSANYKIDFDKLMPLKGNEVSYVGISGVKRDFTRGAAISTENPLNIMIEKSGFFEVMTKDGVRFTRAGDFSRSPEGYLTTKSGDPVQGENGSIILGKETFEVNANGEVFQGSKLLDKIKIVDFVNTERLESVGRNYFVHTGPESDKTSVENPQLLQGFLEGSNVNPIENLTAMIMSHRSFEAYQKATSNYDRMMEKSSNTIGEVRG